MTQTEEELREFARQPDGTYVITGDMIIGDVVVAFPKAIPIMLSHGLHCVGCHASAFDTIEDGARGHGMPDEEIAQMVVEINTAVNKVIETIEMTPAAVRKVKELRTHERGKETWPLRIAITSQCCGFEYDMDFGERKPDDVVILCEDLEVLVDPQTMPLLKGSSIDYVETLRGSGFRIDNPNARKGCAC